MQSGADLESPSSLGITLAEMHAAVSHRDSEMPGKLPFGTPRCADVDVGSDAKSSTIAVD